MNKLIFLFLIIFLVGCTEVRYFEVPVEKIVTEKVYVEECENTETVYVNNTNTVYVNATAPCNCRNISIIHTNNTQYIYDGNSSHMAILINRIRWYESQQSQYLNTSIYYDRWKECEDTLNEIESALE